MAEEINTNASTGENTQVGAPAGDNTAAVEKKGANAKGGAKPKQGKKPVVPAGKKPAKEKPAQSGEGGAPTPGDKSEAEVLAEAAQKLMAEHNLKAIYRCHETGHWFTSEEFAKENCGHKYTPYLKD